MNKLQEKWQDLLSRIAKREKPQPSTAAVETVAQFQSMEELLRGFLLIFVLVVFLLISSLAVVMSAFEYRQLFNNHQVLLKQRDELQVEWGQLLLEQSAWAANNRVEQQATTALSMQVPELEQIKVVVNER